MALRPLQDWAVITKSGPEERTAGGIFIPEVAREKPLEGVIVSIGPGKFKTEKGKEKEKKKTFVPTVLKPGQHILYQKYAEREIELDGVTVTLVREEDILGVLEGHALAERKTGAVEQKKEGPVAVREKAHVPLVPPVKRQAEKVTAGAGKKAAKRTTAKRPPKKKEKVEKKATKPAAKKSPPKKAPAKKAPKAAKTKASKKAVPAKKTTAKKTAPKKAVAGKPAVKKATKKPAAKTRAARKHAQKKPASAKGKKK